MAERVTPIVRQKAQSGRVSYADPTVLHETSRSRVVFVPFFVPRSDHTELAVKVLTYRKLEGADWVLVDQKSVSLQGWTLLVQTVCLPKVFGDGT